MPGEIYPIPGDRNTGPLAFCLGVNYLLNETAEELTSKQSLVNKENTLDRSA
jgi:hypothetical protein